MMNHDPLEQFVIDHRDEFDDLMPREELFKQVNTNKTRVISLNTITWIRRVAAAIVIFAIGFGASEMLSSLKERGHSFDLISQGEEALDSMDSSFRDFYEMQAYYTQEINLVKNEIIILSNADRVINNEINLELKELQQIFDELQEDLEDQTNDQEVIEAMIMNYRVKLKMLEEMKVQLDPSSNIYEEDNYETVDI